MTVVRLAIATGGRQPEQCLSRPDARPALLTSYYYLHCWERDRHKYAFRNWSMDSGAFSAYKSGKTIDRAEYHEACHRLLDADPTLVEVFALDVIGDWRAGLKNTEAAWEDGIPAIPVYHAGEPEDLLLTYAKMCPKIAISGAAQIRGRATRTAFAQQVMARIWPKPVHGLGFSGEHELMSVPFHSVDASSWILGPAAFGIWKKHGRLSVRGYSANLTGEVDEYLAMEQRLQMRWAKEMALLDSMLAEQGWRGISGAPTP